MRLLSRSPIAASAAAVREGCSRSLEVRPTVPALLPFHVRRFGCSAARTGPTRSCAARRGVGPGGRGRPGCGARPAFVPRRPGDPWSIVGRTGRGDGRDASSRWLPGNPYQSVKNAREILSHELSRRCTKGAISWQWTAAISPVCFPDCHFVIRCCSGGCISTDGPSVKRLRRWGSARCRFRGCCRAPSPTSGPGRLSHARSRGG